MDIGNFLLERLNPGARSFGAKIGMWDPATGGGMEAQATPEQEAMAKQRGFQSYEQMRLWALKRSQPSVNSIETGGGQWGHPGKGSGPVTTRENAMNAPPRNVFERIREAMRGAMPGN